MTCIVALKDGDSIYMAAERGASDDDTILSLTTPKIWQSGPYVFGYAGTLDGERMRYNFKPTPPGATKDIDRFMQTNFIKQLRAFYNEWWIDTSKDADLGLIIGIKGNIYEHNAIDMSLSKFTGNYLSIGSGSGFAYGSLYTSESLQPKDRVALAVNAAINFSTSCMGPVDIIKTK